MSDERTPLLRFTDTSAFPQVAFGPPLCVAAHRAQIQGETPGDVEDSVILRNPDGTSPDTGKKAPRLASLDMFRGLTMVGMILVKNQGSTTDVLTPFQESGACQSARVSL